METKESRQFGGQRFDFKVGGADGFVILPAREHPDGSRPWIWYAPTFIGKLPCEEHDWMFKQFLAAGFSIGGVEVGESFGNPRGRAVYCEYHKRMVEKFGLSAKACLLPQSRGTLMLYNWAVENPQFVRCIGGIYSVCDLRSYPGLKTACPAYGMSEEELGKHLSEHNPIDRLGPLALAGVPILHLHGDSDTVVPLEPNTHELAVRYRKLGGNIEVVIIKGKGHEVCPEFFQSQRFVDFFLENGR